MIFFLYFQCLHGILDSRKKTSSLSVMFFENRKYLKISQFDNLNLVILKIWENLDIKLQLSRSTVKI